MCRVKNGLPRLVQVQWIDTQLYWFSQNDGTNVFLGVWDSTFRAPGNVSVLICTWHGINVKVLGVRLVCQLWFAGAQILL